MSDEIDLEFVDDDAASRVTYNVHLVFLFNRSAMNVEEESCFKECFGTKYIEQMTAKSAAKLKRVASLAKMAQQLGVRVSILVRPEDLPALGGVIVSEMFTDCPICFFAYDREGTLNGLRHVSLRYDDDFELTDEEVLYARHSCAPPEYKVVLAEKGLDHARAKLERRLSYRDRPIEARALKVLDWHDTVDWKERLQGKHKTNMVILCDASKASFEHVFDALLARLPQKESFGSYERRKGRPWLPRHYHVVYASGDTFKELSLEFKNMQPPEQAKT